MGIFQQFPYSNFHEMNLDQIIKIMREMQDEWENTKTEWANYKDFIDNYFANLNLDEETEKALRALIADGTLYSVIDPVIITEVTAWLDDHITQPTTPAIDTSLTIAGAAADAKAAGDKINNLRSDLTLVQNSFLPVSELVANSYVNTDGTIVSGYSNWSRTDFVPVSQCSAIIAKYASFASNYNCFYDINKNFISSFRVEITETNIVVPANAYFAIFSNQTAAIAQLTVKEILKTDAGVVKLNKAMLNTVSTTSAGLTYSVSNDVLTVEGTSTGPFNLNIEGSVTEIPGWLKANTIYYVDIKKQGKGTVFFDVDLYDNGGQFVRSACKLSESGAFNVGSLSGIKGAIVRWYIPTGSAVNAILSNGIYNRPSAYYLRSEMEQAGVVNVNKTAANIENYTSNSVTYSRTDNLIHANGTSSGAVDIRMDGSVNAFPEWIKENTDYLVKIQKSGTGRIVFEVDLYDSNGVFIESACAVEGSGTFSIGSLSGVEGVIVRYYIPIGTTLTDVDIKADVYINNAKNSAAEDAGTTIRVMQYNIGKYRWGYQDINQHGLTEAQYVEKLANYKKFFGKYQPDIVGLQEYVVTMDKAQTHNAYDNLFGPLFNLASASKTDTHETRIFGCCDGDLMRFQNFTGDGRTVSWTVGEIYVDGKTIAVATGPLTPYDNSGDYYDARAEQISAVIQALAAYEYAILIFDSNIKTESELEDFKLIASNAGYTIGNGDYWGIIDTYVSHPGVIYPFIAIDTVWVKGDIKIRNFEALTDEYDALSSDHIPVIADLYIY